MVVSTTAATPSCILNDSQIAGNFYLQLIGGIFSRSCSKKNQGEVAKYRARCPCPTKWTSAKVLAETSLKILCTYHPQQPWFFGSFFAAKLADVLTSSGPDMDRPMWAAWGFHSTPWDLMCSLIVQHKPKNRWISPESKQLWSDFESNAIST